MTTQDQIEELARSKLLGRSIDPVGVVDELLTLTHRVGEIQCTFEGNEALRFSLPDQHLVFDVRVDGARGKLRMMCARLGVLCKECGGQDVSIYGGEGIIQKPDASRLEGNGIASQRVGGIGGGIHGGAARGSVDTSLEVSKKWTVRFKNTPSEHEFTIIGSTA